MVRRGGRKHGGFRVQYQPLWSSGSGDSATAAPERLRLGVLFNALNDNGESLRTEARVHRAVQPGRERYGRAVYPQHERRVHLAEPVRINRTRQSSTVVLDTTLQHRASSSGTWLPGTCAISRIGAHQTGGHYNLLFGAGARKHNHEVLWTM